MKGTRLWVRELGVEPKTRSPSATPHTAIAFALYGAVATGRGKHPATQAAFSATGCHVVR